MKEFNLELAKAGHPAQTRDGRKARIVCFDVKSDVYPILALVEEFDGTEDSYPYTLEGTFDIVESPDDLVMASVKKEGWISVYPPTFYQAIATTSNNVYKTKAEAEKNSGDDAICQVKIEWEE